MNTPLRFARSPLVALTLACTALCSHALFKVVAPDGTVTYTDRPPPVEAGRPVSISKEAAAAEASSSLASLPLELRQAATKFPVVLYTSSDCSPCDNGRRMLQSRGIPFSERSVTSNEDAEALDRLTGGRSVPAVTIGSQALRGFAESDWQSYLDAAGYPRESKLPRDYRQPTATPLVDRQSGPAVAARPRPATPAPAQPAEPPTPAPSPTGIRF